MKASNMRKMSEAELVKEILELQRELFKLRMQKSTGQLNRSHLVRAARKNLARVKTILNEKSAMGEK